MRVRLTVDITIHIRPKDTREHVLAHYLRPRNDAPNHAADRVTTIPRVAIELEVDPSEAR